MGKRSIEAKPVADSTVPEPSTLPSELTLTPRRPWLSASTPLEHPSRPGAHRRAAATGSAPVLPAALTPRTRIAAWAGAQPRSVVQGQNLPMALAARPGVTVQAGMVPAGPIITNGVVGSAGRSAPLRIPEPALVGAAPVRTLPAEVTVPLALPARPSAPIAGWRRQVRGTRRLSVNGAAVVAIVVAVIFPPAGLGLAKSARRECLASGQRGAGLALAAHLLAAAGTGLLSITLIAVFAGLVHAGQ